MPQISWDHSKSSCWLTSNEFFNMQYLSFLIGFLCSIKINLWPQKSLEKKWKLSIRKVILFSFFLTCNQWLRNKVHVQFSSNFSLSAFSGSNKKSYQFRQLWFLLTLLCQDLGRLSQFMVNQLKMTVTINISVFY